VEIKMAAAEQRAPAVPGLEEAVRKTLREMSPDQLRAMAGRNTDADRKQRYAEQVKARLARVTLVRFTKNYFNYNSGEVAGLAPKDANAAISEGFAIAIGGVKPVEEAPREDEQKRDTERVQVEQVVKFLGALDPTDPEHFDKGGKPNRSKLSRLAGFEVTPALVDAAMAKAKSDAAQRGT
jgi:hypothetical protein